MVLLLSTKVRPHREDKSIAALVFLLGVTEGAKLDWNTKLTFRWKDG